MAIICKVVHEQDDDTPSQLEDVTPARLRMRARCAEAQKRQAEKMKAQVSRKQGPPPAIGDIVQVALHNVDKEK
eukprot:scaffold659193_cov62-Prasinocladus_malaysianus.AAC.1